MIPSRDHVELVLTPEMIKDIEYLATTNLYTTENVPQGTFHLLQHIRALMAYLKMRGIDPNFEVRY